MNDGDDHSDDVAEILARFPGLVMLSPWKPKWIGICFGATLLMGLLARESWSAAGRGDLAFALVGGLGAVLCAYADIIAILASVTDLIFMRLDAEGFDTQYVWLRRRRSWREVSRFDVGWLGKARVVMFDDETCAPGFFSGLNSFFGGYNSYLSDTYGFAKDDFARLMNEWRERALAEPH